MQKSFFWSSFNFSDKTFNDKLRANKIGIIYQDKNLLSDFSVLENIYLARLALKNDKNRAIKMVKISIVYFLHEW